MLIGYWNIKLLSTEKNTDEMVEDSLFIDVQATMLIYKFSEGSKLVGKIVKLGKDHIALNLLNDVNVSVKSEFMRKEFRFEENSGNSDSGKWTFSMENGQEIELKEGSFLSFVVKSVKTGKDDYFYVEGSLLEEETGPSSECL